MHSSGRVYFVDCTEIVSVELPRLVLLSALEVVLEAFLAPLVVLLAQLLVLQHLVRAVDAHKGGMRIRVVLKMES